MRQFALVFFVALVCIVPFFVVFFLKRFRKVEGSDQGHLKQLEELGKLTGGLAHEIKNPLSTIKINLKLISENLDRAASGQTGLKDEQWFTGTRRKISVIQKEADRLEQTLDSFLRYIGRSELHLSSTDINEVVSNMVDFYSPQAYSHSITIRQGLCDEKLICKIDENMLKQAILNLFINAQQAMNEGGELMIRTSRQKEKAVLQISDTGRGIAPDELKHIFDAYYSSRPHGSGLGLPTVKKVIDAHNGTIKVDSEPGRGTLFTIMLPIEA
ncbi:MAG: two-component system sensor histidine kinase NtrB [Planctomycetota bacterium]|jgi:signal transduction histidine kinase